MARPRKGVTLENANQVKWYFSNALDDHERRKDLLVDEKNYGQLAELEKIPTVQYCDINKYQEAVNSGDKYYIQQAKQGEQVADPIQLDEWVLEHITKKGWQQCLSNIRQSLHASVNRNKKVQVKISLANHVGLKQLANERNQSIDELIEILLKKERGSYR